MEELKSLVRVTVFTASIMAYARFVSSLTSPGKHRLSTLLPAILFLPYLPFYFSTFHFRMMYAFFLTWLATFKLLLLAFGTGPLSPSLPYSLFFLTASFPLKFCPSQKEAPQPYPLPRFLLKILLLTIILPLYKYKHRLHPYVLLAVYNLHLYIAIDLVLTSTAFLTSFLLRIDIGSQFHVPFTSSSLQEFWGRRWNVMVTDILRPAVYLPVKSRYGSYVGIMASFVVSGVMHEIIFYYLTLERTSGEALCFFVLQGLLTVLEVKARREKWWRPHPVVAVLLSLGFVMVTTSSLLFQPLIRNGVDEKAVQESKAVMEFFVGGLKGVLLWVWGFLH